DLQFGHQLSFRHCSEQRMKRLARLKIDWSVFDLQQNVRREFAIERLKIFVSGSGSIIAGLHVINESPPHHYSIMSSHSRRKHIGSVNVIAIVSAWPRLAFAVGLYQKSAKIGNDAIDFIRLFLPPLNHRRIERISGLQPSKFDRRRKS